jgi:hypothetical protein
MTLHITTAWQLAIGLFLIVDGNVRYHRCISDREFGSSLWGIALSTVGLMMLGFGLQEVVPS